MTATLLERARRATPLGRFARPRAGVVAAAVALMLVAAAFLAAAWFERTYAGRVLPGVSVAGIDLGGASPEEARASLANVPIQPAGLVLVVGSRTETVAPDVLGRRIAIDAAVDRAMAAGRERGFLGDIGERIGLLRDGRQLPLGVAVDEPALAAWIAGAAGEIRREPIDAAIVPTGAGWEMTMSVRGAALDEAAATGLIRDALLGGVAGTPRIVLPVRSIGAGIDDEDVALAIQAATRMTANVQLTLDDKSWTIASKRLRGALDFVQIEGRIVPVTNGSRLEAAVGTLSAKVKVAPRQTLLLKTKSGAMFGYVPGAAGQRLDVKATARAVAELVAERRDRTSDPSTEVELATIGVQPKISSEQAAAIAPRMTRISTWTTSFHVGERNGFGNNIVIPARLINGTVVRPGEVFDFWRAVGPVTAARGFRLGGIIQGGRTNPTGAIGGGICSASTTLFNAAVRGGFQILERSPHYYYITRYPLGLDATVSKSGGVSTQNMRFRNDTGVPIYIRGLAGSGWVRFEIYSLPTGRSVTFSKPSVSNIRRAVDRVVRTSALRAGTSRRDETPANGMDVAVVRTVRDARGTVIHRDRFVSHYARVDGLLLIGIG
ncbi:MAG TPA: VanW family protein [Candidatus Limnocylindrales bacterium]|jgi:vancomycin resistance protein YoaR|nr:VanW family protein [Candidatus Limnocylindrales bacterium]